MITLIRAALVATVLLFLPALLEQWEAPKTAVVRIVGFALLGLALFDGDRLRRFKPTALDLAMAAWLAIEILSVLTARSLSIAVFGDAELHEGLVTSVALAGFYLATRLAMRGPDAIARTLDLWLAAALLGTLYVFLQVAHLDVISWSQTATIGGTVRPIGTFGHPNLMGLLTGAAAVIALARGVVEQRWRVIHFVAAALFATAAVLSFSRGAWIGLVAGLVVAAVLASRAGGVSMKRLALACGVAAVVVVLVVAVSGMGGALATRLAQLVNPVQESGRARLEIWRTAWAAFQARPVLGQGPDNFGLIFTQYQTPEYWRYEWGMYAAHAHSIALHTLATRGLLGLLAALAVAVAAALAAWTAWRDAGQARGTLVAMIGGLIVIAAAGAFGSIGISGAVLVTVMLAMIVNLAAPVGTPRPAAEHAAAAGAAKGSARDRGAHARTPRAPKTEPRRAPIAGWAWGAAIGLGLIAAFVTANQLVASHVAWQTRDWVARGVPADTQETGAVYALEADRCQKAMARVPADDDLPRLVAQDLITWSKTWPDPMTLIQGAEGAAREAVRRQPLRASNHRWLGLALSVRALAGDSTAIAPCDQAFEEASRRAPVDGQILVEWSRTSIRLREPARAMPRVERAVELYPRDAQALATLAEAQWALRDTDLALASAERALSAEWAGDTAARASAAGWVARVRALRDHPR